MSGNKLPRAYTATPVTDKDTLHKATLAICSMAGDAKTARPVLEMLGLIPPLQGPANNELWKHRAGI